jgi:hypothetical protein
MRLHDDAHPSPGTSVPDTLDRDQFHEIDRLLAALDAWTTWSEGRPVAMADLAESAEVLSHIARETPVLATKSGEIDRSEWLDALQPLLELLCQGGIQLARTTRQVEIDSPGLGVEL